MPRFLLCSQCTASQSYWLEAGLQIWIVLDSRLLGFSVDQFCILEYMGLSEQQSLCQIEKMHVSLRWWSVQEWEYLPEYGLDFLGPGLWFFVGDLGRLDSLLGDLHHASKIKRVSYMALIFMGMVLGGMWRLLTSRVERTAKLGWLVSWRTYVYRNRMGSVTYQVEGYLPIGSLDVCLNRGSQCSILKNIGHLFSLSIPQANE